MAPMMGESARSRWAAVGAAVGLALLSACAAPCPVYPDRRTPLCAFQTFLQAMRTADQDVIEDCAFRGGKDGVLNLSRRQAGDVVGGQFLQEIAGAGAPDVELSHMADIEETRPAANRQVLVDDAGELHRHFPAGKPYHPAALSHDQVMKAGFPQAQNRFLDSVMRGTN